MRIVFCGTSSFAVPSLELLAKDFEVSLVITQPDKPAGRGQKLTPSAVKQKALELNLKISQPEKISFLKEELLNLKPDIMIVVSYGQIIPKSMLEIPRFKSLNLHGSILPKYRGAAPIQRALMQGEKETGNTVILMSSKMDEGDILSMEKTLIEEQDNYETLSNKLSISGAKLLKDTILNWVEGNITPTPQNHQEATYAMPILKEELRICFKTSAFSIHNKIRGLYPNAYGVSNNHNIKILKTKILEKDLGLKPGELLQEGKSLFVGTGDYPLEILEIMSLKGKRVSGKEFAMGYLNQIKQFY
ncbi:MAG: methionyl-tRNA formyltransferase [Hydrogenobaculum sp.]|nr:MAG: methionyl-tRNA formyltransferase [Hydrogenobaculum sp.]